MPAHCCVPQCKSNYAGTNEYVSVFKFPTDKTRSELWLKKIPRKNFTPNPKTVVCVKHFEDDMVIRFDKLTGKDGQPVIFPRSYPKLTDYAYPTIFPGCPSYLSEKKALTRTSRDEKLKKLDDATFQKFMESDKIENFESFKNTVEQKMSHVLPEDSIVYNRGSNVYIIFLSYDPAPEIIKSLVIHEDMSIQIYSGKNEVNNCAYVHLLNQFEHLKLWSEAENIFSLVKNMSQDVISVSPYELSISHWKSFMENNEDEYDQKSFLLEQMKLCNTLKMGRRYSSNLYAFAYSLYMKSTACYYTLYKSDLIILPSIDNLRKLLNILRLDVSTNSASNVEYIMAKGQKLLDNDKKVNLIIDEIHVAKKIAYKGKRITGFAENQENTEASSVQSFMISALFSKYKEIIALVPVSKMTSDNLYDLTVQALHILNNAGFDVLCIVSDNNRVNRKMFEKLAGGNMVDSIRNPANQSKNIFLLFDSVHLLKSIRNNWINQLDFEKTFICPDFNDKNKNIFPKFGLLRKMFHIEKDSIIRYAHRLSYKSMYPSNLERQNVKPAVYVFHESNPAALEMHAKSNPSFANWEDTAVFLKLIKRWWDIMNVSHFRKGIVLRNSDAQPFTSVTDEKIDFLNNFVSWLDAWKSMQHKARCGALTEETFFALRHTCATIILVAKHLLLNGATYVLTTKFHSDPLEFRFSQYRQMSGGNFHISVQQILESERKLRLKTILQLRSSQFGNISLKDFAEVPSNIYDVDCSPYENLIQNIDIEDISTSEAEVLTYIAGYCVYKLRLLCDSCKLFFTNNSNFEPCNEGNNKFLENNAVSYTAYLDLINRGGMKMPSSNVVFTLCICYKIFQKLISNEYESIYLSSNDKQHSLLVKLTELCLHENCIFDITEVCENCNDECLNGIRKIICTFSNICLNNYTKVLSNKQLSNAADKRKLKKFKS